MTERFYEDFKLPEEAAEWLMRLAADNSVECRRGFHSWFRQSPRHVRAFLEATEVSRSLNAMDLQRQIDVEALIAEARTNVVTFGGGTQSEDRPRKHSVIGHSSSRLRWSIAAGIVIALGISSVAVLTLKTPSRSIVTTAIGEQRTLKLADGSLVTLNTRSQIDIRFSKRARDVRLLNGQALFEVARDSERPFRVSTRDAMVQAIGTQFDVHQGNTGTRVAVIEGAVQVTPDRTNRSGSARPERLGAGEEARVSTLGELHLQTLANPAAVAAWRVRRLEFHDAPLTEAAAEFNRYNRLQIHIDGALDADKRITGIFSADSPEALVKFLRRDESLIVEQRQDGFIVRQDAGH